MGHGRCLRSILVVLLAVTIAAVSGRALAT